MKTRINVDSHRTDEDQFEWRMTKLQNEKKQSPENPKNSKSNTMFLNHIYYHTTKIYLNTGKIERIIFYWILKVADRRNFCDVLKMVDFAMVDLKMEV